MSWPLASFLIVGVVLGGGWLAYERTRPSARTAAVVAIMAALAALGRDAFAALPDVKPITAMTFVAGYALGPLPGFTVGALGMLVSNFMLGQGPYTPWQMAAWGMVGLGGAVLGRLSGRRLGRLPLALACGASALAAKEVMNLYTWTLGASHTPAAFLAVAGQAVAYDITDTIASFLFGLAFAPELARVLARMRMRMDVTWEGAPVAPPPGAGPTTLGRRSLGAAGALLAVAVAGTLLLAGPRAAGAGAPVSRQIAFLERSQNADGGFGGARGQSSSELYSGWAAMGLAAAGRDPLSVRRNGHSVLDALRGEASSLQGAGDLERTILALHACGVSVRALPGAGGDPVSRLLRYRSGDGSFGHLSNLTAFAVFALRAAGYSSANPTVRGAGSWLLRQQNVDGGFGFATRGGGSDVDDTAAALQALVDAGTRRGSALARALAFLVRAQNPDGGYPQQKGGESNAQSTAWAVQGLVAGGRDPRGVTRAGSRSPLGYLATLLAPDGSVRYSRTGAQTPVWVTAQALTALGGKPLPIAPLRSHRATVTGAVPGPPAHAATAARHSRAASGHGTAHPALPATPGLPAAAGRRLDRLAHSIGALVGALVAPMLR
ncbi:MAG TPA: prenyltransferase/squalene oxidase repeat-containing protein [Solirubrobacteraceae bacterium]|jgi:energy-coupling factor transport system substrate-specific component|nr:prenyltransferase/squalene oxidase repeat-containing protein [Solirubrobacteraceae bacterium]